MGGGGFDAAEEVRADRVVLPPDGERLLEVRSSVNVVGVLLFPMFWIQRGW